MHNEFELIDRVIEKYPYPITSKFSRLGTPECQKLGDRRMLSILGTAEAVSCFLCALILCLCRDKAENKGLASTAILSADSTLKLMRPSWGTWMQFSREGLSWLLSERDSDPLTSELAKFFLKHPPKNTPSEAADALKRLLETRNAIHHNKRPIHTDGQIEEVCEETYPDLIKIIESLNFLENYYLDFVSEIEVTKRRRQDPSFNHTFGRILGDRQELRWIYKNYPSTILENSAVIFRRSDDKSYLNLDPLLVREERAGSAPDLFFFNGMKDPSSIYYSACKQGGKFESNKSKRGKELAEEMANLLSLLVPMEGIP